MPAPHLRQKDPVLSHCCLVMPSSLSICFIVFMVAGLMGCGAWVWIGGCGVSSKSLYFAGGIVCGWVVVWELVIMVVVVSGAVTSMIISWYPLCWHRREILASCSAI